jgi:hypothetical protein
MKVAVGAVDDTFHDSRVWVMASGEKRKLIAAAFEHIPDAASRP